MKTKSGYFSPDDLVKLSQPPKLYSVEAGNKVVLASGGPVMTVCDFEGTAPEGWAECQWLDEGEVTLQKARFSIVTLTCPGSERK